MCVCVRGGGGKNPALLCLTSQLKIDDIDHCFCKYLVYFLRASVFSGEFTWSEFSVGSGFLFIVVFFFVKHIFLITSKRNCCISRLADLKHFALTPNSISISLVRAHFATLADSFPSALTTLSSSLKHASLKSR